MKKVFLLFLAALCLGLMGMGPPFPGDGYDNPDAFGVSGHGPALSYTDNGDGTFTDNVTKRMWEVKLAADGSDGGDCDEEELQDRNVHCVNNGYTWSTNNLDPNGTLFSEFLETLNKTCEGEGVDECETHKDCAKGEKCGFAGRRDWCIPNIKMLQSIVDTRMINVASSVPGPTAGSFNWSVTTFADGVNFNEAWGISFNFGSASGVVKGNAQPARAVRPCS